MDYTDAIEQINELMENENYLNEYSGASNQPMNIALYLATEALKKQIPEKPVNQGSYEECPICEKCIPASKMFIFCGFCGQQLLR